MSQKIAVLGTGANGSCIAASLIDAGRDVVLIDQWPAHVEAMRATRLTITMPETERRGGVRPHQLSTPCTVPETFAGVLRGRTAADPRGPGELIKPYLATDGML